ncbi:MAG: hypothetical protein GX358_06515 [candidate division WS1 bacterium]|nr:hypothetical protein [candidate division WS1 bacterium]
MTPRQRLIAALKHQEADRVPRDLGGPVTGIHRDAYDRLKILLGIDEPTEIFDLKQQLASCSEAVLQALGIDTRFLDSGSRAGEGLEISEDEQYFGYRDEWGIEWRMPKAKPLYYDMVNHPLAGLSAEDLAHYDFPPLARADAPHIAELGERARELYEGTDYALVAFGPGRFFEFAWYLRGFENYMMDMVLDEHFLNRLLDVMLEHSMADWEAQLSAVGPYVQVVQMADDLGHQGGPMMSLELYRKYIKPRQKELIAFVRERTDAFMFLHSCGSIRQFLPDFIEVGIDIINPVQPGAADMDAQALKSEFGDRLSFWGGIDTQRVLPEGTPEEVAEETRRVVEILGHGGGYVLNSVHNIQADVPAENVVAMYGAETQ